jgi:signal transduction histidine kinase
VPAPKAPRSAGNCWFARGPKSKRNTEANLHRFVLPAFVVLDVQYCGLSLHHDTANLWSHVTSASKFRFTVMTPAEDTWIWISLTFTILLLCILVGYLQYSRAQLRQAKDRQQLLSRLLINAQEKERSRLAAELHDDFSQRLAALVLGLENMGETLPASEDDARQELKRLLETASELGEDLHTVSHRLHPASLENLGLVPGLTTLCREFRARQGVTVHFSADEIPRGVPASVALCLFRIAQESLQNLRKHSGASEAHVSLRKMGERLCLTISDDGVGFYPKESRYSAGLGLRSMEERTRLLGGEFEIHSEPGKGTKVTARVPLQSEEEPVPTQSDLLWIMFF